MAVEDEVTIVVPAYERVAGTCRLLESMVKAQIGCEVIVVDDASCRSLSGSLPSFPSLRVRFIRNNRNTGPSASRNIGIGLARTQFVVFTDNDVTVTPEWLPTLHAQMASAPADVAGVGGRVLDDGTNLVGEYATRHGLLNPYMHGGRVVYLVTANCIFRTSAVLSVGGFDERFRVPGGEDPELSFRLLKAGYRLEYAPQAIVHHSYSGSWLAFYRQFRRYGRGCRRAMETLQASQA